MPWSTTSAADILNPFPARDGILSLFMVMNRAHNGAYSIEPVGLIVRTCVRDATLVSVVAQQTPRTRMPIKRRAEYCSSRFAEPVKSALSMMSVVREYKIMKKRTSLLFRLRAFSVRFERGVTLLPLAVASCLSMLCRWLKWRDG